MAFMALWGRAALSPSAPSVAQTPRRSLSFSTMFSFPYLTNGESVCLTEMPRSDHRIVRPTDRRLHICPSRWNDYTAEHLKLSQLD